ncbi:MAG: S46 family peptidase [Flavobacteriales bacterium]|nr:S46 family peptidase [Flavobacteriales bacterium]MEB2340610.1 S46 family peptidase [Flavobacteriia bacterium]
MKLHGSRPFHLFIFLVITTICPAVLRAHEGMWLPTLLKAIEGDMQSEGLQLTAEDIYSINHGSLKDAVVLFGGGCTAEVISNQGLILTNHHCGYGTIQRHSTLEHNYLRDGFRAATLADEIPSPGLTATFIVRMEDVTARMQEAFKAGMTEEERDAAARTAGEALATGAVAGTGHKAVVRPFNFGNSWYLIVSETFTDVRLVATPPSAIGKFGGDTDNWVWPRHTGDFSVFRIYAGPGNVPADYSAENAPLKPRHSLPINVGGVKEGDFAMIFGFPGSTQRYLPSFAVEQVVDVIDPLRIGMRTASLNVINAAMLGSERVKLQYAGKQSRISNGWKKWQGEVQGLKALDAVGLKTSLEEEFTKRAAGRPEYAEVLGTLAGLYKEYLPYAVARELFVEMVYMGPEFLRFADGHRKLIEQHGRLREDGQLEAELAKLRTAAHGFFNNYVSQVDQDVFGALLPIYRKHAAPGLSPAELNVIDTRYGGSTDRYVQAIFSKSLFTDSTRLYRALDRFSPKVARQMANDPAYTLMRAFTTNFMEQVRPRHGLLSDDIEGAMRTWSRGLMELFPEKTWWPDANSTLRLSYGKVEGAEPRDGIVYRPFTTLEGVMEKMDPSEPDFEVPQKLIDLYQAKDYGPYGADGEMPVCFLSSLHTTGGNSGSPILNGRGELIGLNFDRMWESTMSDILFDPAKCRNISVDIRYVLFILDKYLGASRLIDEMELVSAPDPMPMIDLPLHR